MYTLNAESARKADRAGQFIDQIGKYTGTFVQVYEAINKNGTHSMVFTFESNGQKITIPLYTRRADGTSLPSEDSVHAILACLRMRGVQEVSGSFTEYDYNLKKEVERQGNVFPDLCKKPIGLLLETEDYYTNAGDMRTRMVLAGVFEAKTELIASEILDKKTMPEQLPKMVARLHHRKAKQRNDVAAPAHANTHDTGIAGMDNDIPF